jgi:hypothetical protein
MRNPLASLPVWLLALLLVSVPACSRREVFDSENAAKTAVWGKKAHDVMARLGTPGSITSGGVFDETKRYTECWKYPRLVRDRSTGELKTFHVYLSKSHVVAVSVEK